LIVIYPNESNVVGILHLAPHPLFRPGVVADGALRAFKQWPVVKAHFELEWTLEGARRFSAPAHRLSNFVTRVSGLRTENFVPCGGNFDGACRNRNLLCPEYSKVA
jgi:hypothetical protein